MAIGRFNTITIDGKEIFRPNEFTLQREQIYAAEIETCTGKKCADLVGWRYSDMTLTFDVLPQDQMEKLLGLMGSVNMRFSNELNRTVTEEVIMRSSNAQVTRLRDLNNKIAWKNFQISISFIDAHPNEEN